MHPDTAARGDTSGERGGRREKDREREGERGDCTRRQATLATSRPGTPSSSLSLSFSLRSCPSSERLALTALPSVSSLPHRQRATGVALRTGSSKHRQGLRDRDVAHRTRSLSWWCVGVLLSRSDPFFVFLLSPGSPSLVLSPPSVEALPYAPSVEAAQALPLSYSTLGKSGREQSAAAAAMRAHNTTKVRCI